MYTMTIDKRPLYDPARTGYALEIPDGVFEANKIGTLTFTIYPEHPEYNSITPRVSVIRVYRDGDIYALYRPVRARRMLQGGMEYTCEEMTALLNDFMRRPAAFPVDPDHGSARDLMQLCITEYNTRSTETKVVPPHEYVLSLPWPFVEITYPSRLSAGIVNGVPSSFPSEDETYVDYGWPRLSFRKELANVLAVLGYFGNIYIPPSYNWEEISDALGRFARAHNLSYGYRRIYNPGNTSYVDWYGTHVWDPRPMDQPGIVAALNSDFEALRNAQDDDPGSDASDYEPIIFSVGDTPAAYDADTGDPISLTVEENGYSGFWDYMQEAIVDQLGGYIIPEWRENSCILHYKRDEHLPTCNQAVRFGENMIDLIIETDAEKVYSIVIPLGKDGLTINADPLEPDYIADADAVNMYGKREMTKEWADITDRDRLKYTATQWLMENAIRLKDEFEVDALDLRHAGVNVEHLDFMHRVVVELNRYGINQMCTMSGKEFRLDTPENDKCHFNGERDSLVDKIKK